MDNVRHAIKTAHKFLAEGNPHMANYVLRDLPEVKAAGLDELAWALHAAGDAHKNDVLVFIRDLEATLTKK